MSRQTDAAGDCTFTGLMAGTCFVLIRNASMHVIGASGAAQACLLRVVVGDGSYGATAAVTVAVQVAEILIPLLFEMPEIETPPRTQ
ncbi:MAG: hypothetical protein GY703_08005 [Gammaproteobacteria bacterium]|nr:hypothetical protein [Gammaproteobacteria bacterium]